MLTLSQIDHLHGLGEYAEFLMSARIGLAGSETDEHKEIATRNVERSRETLADAITVGLSMDLDIDQMLDIIREGCARLVARWESESYEFMRVHGRDGRTLLEDGTVDLMLSIVENMSLTEYAEVIKVYAEILD